MSLVVLMCLGMSACAAASGPAAPAPASERPNIVFLFSDDHAAHAISAYQTHLRYGIKLPNTPNLDRLARDGMLFVNSFVTNSICGPARATVLTGQYGHINGVMTNSEPLHQASVTFPRLLREAGYETALFGKWHLRTRPEGFDRYEILAGQGPYYNPVLHSGADSVRHTGYTLDIVTDRAIEWVQRGRSDGKPFMLMLNFNAPHRWWDPGPAQLALFRDTAFAIPSTFDDRGEGRASPARDPEMKIGLDLVPRDLKLDPPTNLTAAQRVIWDAAYTNENSSLISRKLAGEELVRWKYQRYIADYMRVIMGLDEQVGRMLDALDEAGLSRNTIVVYSSDQGFFLGDHGWFDKRWMYEESLRTPLIVKWPGVVKAGAVNDDLVMNLDLAETFIDIAGGVIPESMQGASLVPLLRGATPPGWRDAIYYQYFEYPGWHAVRRQYGVRTRSHKLIHYYEVGEWELFDLDKDPEELQSVHGDPAYAAVRRDLEQRLTALRTQYSVPARDPAPYYPWSLPPEYRRPGTPGSARNNEIGAAGIPASGLSRGIAAADSIVAAAIGKLTAGAVLLVAKDGKVVHESAHGFAELNDFSLKRLAAPAPMLPGTVFDLASVTKVMATTFAVMMLVDRGQVDLDAPVYRYLPGFRGPRHDSITVRHLLDHSSGLAQWQPMYYHARNGREVLRAIKAMPLQWGVGTGRHYSDLGFMLLGYIAESASGQTLDRFVRDNLYAPLGVKAAFNPRSNGLSGFAATEQGNAFERRMVYDSTFGYRYRGDPAAWNDWRQQVLSGEVNDGNAFYAHGGVAGHAGLFGTARDMSVLLDVLLSGGTVKGRTYVSRETIAKFLSLDRHGHYLGWQLPADSPRGSFMHTGFTGTYVLGVPEHGLAVVLLTNRQNLGPDARGQFPDLTPLRAAVARTLIDGAALDHVTKAELEPANFRSGRWFKGNTHTHTLESDGDSPPEVVARWYKTHGYNFLVISDHNVWVDPSKLSHLVDSAFLLIPGEELTSSFQRKPVHVNGLNVPAVIQPQTDSTLVGTIQKNVDAVRKVAGVPHINHPNFGWAMTPEVLAKIRNDKLIEIHNGHPLVHNDGGGDSPGMEAVWDYLLTGGKRIYGIAVDDAHHFTGEFGPERSNPGRGWVSVRAASLDARVILEQMEAGRFYASTGVELDSLDATPAALTIHIRQRGNFKYTTQFIGRGGRVLARVPGQSATYQIRGDEMYVRAKVTDSGGRHAWVQPIFIRE